MNSLKIDFLGKLPDPFLRNDGTRVTPAEWPAYKQELRLKITDIEFGGMPPKADRVNIERINQSGVFWYRVTAFRNPTSFRPERALSFILSVETSPADRDAIMRGESVSLPVLMTGDGCYHGCESDVVAEATGRGYAVCKFNRLEIVNDGPRQGPLYGMYDDYPDFTAISAWAWGYMTALDALEQLAYINCSQVGITGHSRGGKTVLLAAAWDERFQYVCPNNSGTHGCASYRVRLPEQGDIYPSRTEELGDMLERFPYWMGPKLKEYASYIETLPYDMHFFGALIAPRFYLQCEGMQDYWINPHGSWQNFMAVKACYRYLGCENNAAAWFRPGKHRHKLPDFTEFLNFMDDARAGKPLAPYLRINPYPEDGKQFDWDTEQENRQ